jgi:hypothetical protein
MVTINCVAITLGQVLAYGAYIVSATLHLIESDVNSNRRHVGAYAEWLEMDGRAWSSTWYTPTVEFAPFA